VYGRPAATPCLQLRLTNVLPWVPVAAVTAGLERYGRVLRMVHGRLPGLLSAYDGVLHIQLQPAQGVELPSFLALAVGDHLLSEVLPIFTDDYVPRCFWCGGRHSGLLCRLAARPIHQQGAVWGRLVLPTPPPLSQVPLASTSSPSQASAANPPSPDGCSRHRKRRSTNSSRTGKRGKASSPPVSLASSEADPHPGVRYSFAPSGRLCRGSGLASNDDYAPCMLKRYLRGYAVTCNVETIFGDHDIPQRSDSAQRREQDRLERVDSMLTLPFPPDLQDRDGDPSTSGSCEGPTSLPGPPPPAV